MLFQALAVLAILTVATQLGAASAVVRPVARHDAVGNTEAVRRTLLAACGPVALVALGLAGIVFLGAADLAALLTNVENQHAATSYLRWFSITLPIAAILGIVVSALRGLGDMPRAALVELILVPALRLMLAVAIVSLTVRAAIIGSIWASAALVGLVIATWMLSRRLRTRNASDHLERSFRQDLGEFWSFAAPQSASSLLQTSVLWLDVLLLGVLASAGAAGIYGAVSRLAVAGTLPLVAVALAIAPQVSRLFAEHRHERLAVVYRTSAVWVVTISAPFYVLLAFFSPYLVTIFGSDFAAGATPLRVLAVANLAEIASGPVLVVLLMGGRSGLVLATSVLGLALNVLLNILLIPIYGATGAAVAWGATIVFANSLAVLLVWKTWSLHPFSSTLRDVSLAAVAVYGIASTMAYIAFGWSLVGLVAASCAGTLAYVGVLWTRSDRLQLGSLRGVIETR